MTKPTEKDSVHAFYFEDFPVRGKLVHLDASWQAVLERKEYPKEIKDYLGQALAAAVLLASTLKLDGRLTMQFQSDGPLSLLLSQCTSDYRIRGLAHWKPEVEWNKLFENFKGGRMAITIESKEDGQRYQGIVPLESDSLAGSVEAYFDASEQLPTRLWFANDNNKVVGMLLQKMPREGGKSSAENDADAWPRVQLLADTITSDELLQLSDAEIIRRLFHEEDIRLFDSTPVSFSCSCSMKRIEQMLQGLGEQEVQEIIEERGDVQVDCEFCGKNYRLDAIDISQLFSDAAVDVSKKTH